MNTLQAYQRKVIAVLSKVPDRRRVKRERRKAAAKWLRMVTDALDGKALTPDNVHMAFMSAAADLQPARSNITITMVDEFDRAPAPSGIPLEKH